MFHWGQLLQSSSDIALMDERPPDDEIERAYLAIRKDLLGEYGRPRELSHTKDSPAEFRQSQMLVWKLPDSILTFFATAFLLHKSSDRRWLRGPEARPDSLPFDRD